MKLQDLKAEIVKRGQQPITGNKSQIKAQLQQLIDQEIQNQQNNNEINKSTIQLQQLVNTMPLNLDQQPQQQTNPFNQDFQNEPKNNQQNQFNTDDFTLRAFNITGQLPSANQYYKQQIIEDNLKYQKTSNSPLKILKPKNVKIEQTPTQEQTRDFILSDFFQQSRYQQDYQQNQLIQTNNYQLSQQVDNTQTMDQFDKPINISTFQQSAQGIVDDNNVQKIQKTVRFVDNSNEVYDNNQKSNLISDTVIQHAPSQQEHIIQSSNFINTQQKSTQLSPQLIIPQGISRGNFNNKTSKKIIYGIGISVLILSLIILSLILSLDIKQAKLHCGSISVLGLKIIRMFLPKQYIQDSKHYTIFKPQQCNQNAICNDEMSFQHCESGYQQYQTLLRSGSDVRFKLHNNLVNVKKTIDNLLNYKFQKESQPYYKIYSCTQDLYKQKYYDQIFIKETKKLLQTQAKQFCKHKKQSDVLNDMRVKDLQILQALNNETQEYLQFLPQYIQFQRVNSLMQDTINQQEQTEEYLQFQPIYISTSLDYMKYLPKICQFTWYVKNNKLSFALSLLKYLLTTTLLIASSFYFIIRHKTSQFYNLIKQYLVDDYMNHEQEQIYSAREKYGAKETVLIQKFVPKLLQPFIKQSIVYKLQNAKDIGKSFSRNRNGIAENIYYYKGDDNGFVKISKSNSSELTDDNDIMIEY